MKFWESQSVEDVYNLLQKEGIAHFQEILDRLREKHGGQSIRTAIWGLIEHEYLKIDKGNWVTFNDNKDTN